MNRGLPMLALSAALLAAGCGGPVPATSAELLTQAAHAYSQDNDERTVALTERFLALHGRAPESAEAHYLRGLALARQGQLAAAEGDFLLAAAHTRRPELAGRAHLAMAQLTGQIDAAETHLRAALDALPRRDPPADEALLRLADLLQIRGQWREADACLDRILFLFEGSESARQAERRIRARAWTVHAGSFLDRSNAQARAEELHGSSLAAQVQPQGSRMVRFDVHAGRYATHEQALQALPAVQSLVPAARIALTRADAGEAPDTP